MMTGRRQRPGVQDPEIGAVVAKALDTSDRVAARAHRDLVPAAAAGATRTPRISARNTRASCSATATRRSSHERPDGLAENAVLCANDLRRKVNDRFALRRRTAETEAYTQCFEQAQELMRQREVFDVTKEPDKDRERYGRPRFRPALPARPAVDRKGHHLRAGHAFELRHAQRELQFPFRAGRRVRRPVRHADRRSRRARTARTHAGRRALASSAARRTSTSSTAATIGARRGRSASAAPASSPARSSARRTTPAPKSPSARSTPAISSTPTSPRSASSPPATSRSPVKRCRWPIRPSSRSTNCSSDDLICDASRSETGARRAGSHADATVHDLHCFDPRVGSFSAARRTARSTRWDLASDAQGRLEGARSWIGYLAVTPDGETLISAGYDDTLIWWPAAADAPAPIRTKSKRTTAGFAASR